MFTLEFAKTFGSSDLRQVGKIVTQAVIRITNGVADDLWLDSAANRLRDILLEDGLVESAERHLPTSESPETRGNEVLEAGLLIVQLAAEAGLIEQFLRRIQLWRDAQPASEVEVEVSGSRIVLSNATPEQQQVLVDHFIANTLPGASQTGLQSP